MAKAIKKKKWVTIKAPKLFGDVVAGEIPVYESKSVIDRGMRANLSTLVNDMKKQSTEVSIVVQSVEGDIGTTKLSGIKILPTSIKRQVRKGRTRLDQTIKGVTNDEHAVIIKILLITRNIVKGSVFHTLQKEITAFVIKKIGKVSYDELCDEVVNGKLSKDLRLRLNKVYPLRVCDIREFKWDRFIKASDLRKVKATQKGVKLEEKPVDEEMPDEQEATENKETSEQETTDEEPSEEETTDEDSSEEETDKEESRDEETTEEESGEKQSSEEDKI